MIMANLSYFYLPTAVVSQHAGSVECRYSSKKAAVIRRAKKGLESAFMSLTVGDFRRTYKSTDIFI